MNGPSTAEYDASGSGSGKGRRRAVGVYAACAITVATAVAFGWVLLFPADGSSQLSSNPAAASSSLDDDTTIIDKNMVGHRRRWHNHHGDGKRSDVSDVSVFSSRSAREDVYAQSLLIGRRAAGTGAGGGVDGVSSGATWGYAAGRNQRRWKLIAASLLGVSSTANLSGGSDQEYHRKPWWWMAADMSREKGSRSKFVGIDYGADQGYFSIALLRLFTAVNQQAERSTTKLKITERAHRRSRSALVVAVEKGGVGGSLWLRSLKNKQDASPNGTSSDQSVHDIIGKHFFAADFGFGDHHVDHGDDARGGSVALRLCSDEVSLCSFQRIAPAAAAASSHSEHHRYHVQLVLSMLHWVSGVDGEDGFHSAICALAQSAAVTFVELPNPYARKTFGERRYRKWYRYQKNVTALLVKSASRCMARRSLSSDGIGSSSSEDEEERAMMVVSLVGDVPWGKRMSRQIHRIDNYHYHHQWAAEPHVDAPKEEVVPQTAEHHHHHQQQQEGWLCEEPFTLHSCKVMERN